MIAHDAFQVEIAGRLATIYIVGELEASMAPLLCAVCDEFPPTVQMICVSLTDVAQLDEIGGKVIREMHHHWRSTRGGTFRLAFARGEVMRSMTVGTWRMLPARA